jgi:hypothetical protein
MSKVYVDLDGVVAGLDEAVVKFFGPDHPIDALGRHSIEGPEWARLKKEWPTFWIDLPYEAFALDLWKVVGKYASILSAYPSGWPAAETGKKIWVRRMLPKFGYNPKQEIIVCKSRHDKQQYAVSDGTANILIDDHPENVSEWNAAGGIGYRYIPSMRAVQDVADLLKQHGVR